MIVRSLLSVVVLCLAPSVLMDVSRAAAQSFTAQLAGRVVDSSGAALPGATIVVTNEETGAQRTVTAADAGEYLVMNLEPGRYAITAELGGFSKLEQKGLVLSVSQRAQLDLTLAVAGVQEGVTVIADAPLISTTRSEIGTTITPKQVNELPLNGRNFLELALLAPGVKVPLERTSTDISFGASSGRSSNVQVDGADNNDDSVGGGESSFSMESIREFAVVTNRFSAEFGRSNGGVVNIVTKSGTNALQGTAFGFFRDDALKASNWFTGNTVPFTRRQWGGSVGGPIVKNATHFFGTFERQTNADSALPNTGVPSLDVTVDATDNSYITFGKVDHRIGEAHRLFGSYSGTFADATNQSVGGSASIEYGTLRDRQTHSATIGDTWVMSDRMVNDLRVMYRNHDTKGDPTVFKPALLFPSVMLGTRTNYPQYRSEQRIQLRDDLSYFVPSWHGAHALKAGVDLARVSYAIFLASFSEGAYTFTRDPSNFADPSTYPAPTRYQQGLGRFDTDGSTQVFNGYLQDDWQVGNGVTLNLGLRYEVEFGAANNKFVTTRTDLVKPKKTDIDNVSPRLGIAYDVTGKGSTVVRGGFGKFYDQFLLNMSFNERLNNGETFLIADIRPQGSVPISLTDPLGGRTFDDFIRTAAATQVQTIAPDLEVPFTYQSSIGVQQRIGQTAALSVDYVRIDGRHEILRRDINLDPNCVNLNAGCRRPDSRFTAILQSASIGESKYDGLHTSFTWRQSRLSMQAAYTLSKAMNMADDPALGSVISNQFDARADWGPAANDRRHSIVLNGSVTLPYDMQVSGILNAGTGFIILGTRVSEDLNGDGQFTDRPVGVTRNSFRSEGTAKIDLRLSKSVQLGAVKLQGLVEVFNIFNRQNYDPTAYGNRIGTAAFLTPGSSTATYFQPREAQLAFRLSF